MKIGVYGECDKRLFIYPLLKLLQSTGDVAFFTNNRQFKRLLEEGGDKGHFANILVAVSDKTPDEVWELIGHEELDFEHIVYDVTTEYIEGLDFTFFIKTYALSSDEESILELLDNPFQIKIAYDGKRDPVAKGVTPKIDYWKAIEITESHKILEPLKCADVNNIISSTLSTSLKMSTKDIVNVLNRGWNKR